jgi:hypothetical protein
MNMNKPKPPDRQRRDEDSAWKELLDRHFADFLKFFFPTIHAAIDWSRKPIFLDKELPKLGPRHLRGHRLADKLAKVWRKNGRPLFVILHGEIQGRAGAVFNERMYVYNYRIADRFNCPVVSLGIVTGSTGQVVLGRYETKLWGCQTSFKFPVVKLDDWRGREAELLASTEPFALVVLAHLKVRAKKNTTAHKYAVKRELSLLLFERDYSTEYKQSILRFLDWMFRLPAPAELKLDKEIDALTGGKAMQFVTHWERRGEKRGRKLGRQEGREEGQLELVLRLLQKKFGELDARVETQIKRLSLTRLIELAEALLDFTQPTDLERWLKRKAG